MADRYWVGGTGNWSDNTNHWSTSSGGGAGASLPTSSDNVIFNGSSGTGTVTIDAIGNCADFDASLSSILTFQFSADLNCYGSFTLKSGLTVTNGVNSNINFTATTTGKTITTAGNTLPLNFKFNGSGGGWTFQDNVTLSIPQASTRPTIYFTTGTINFGANTFHLGSLFLYSGGNATINLNSAIIYFDVLTGGGFIANTGFTVNAGTSIFYFLSSMGLSNEYGQYTLNIVDFTGTCSITGSFTVNELIVHANSTITIQNGKTITATTITMGGTKIQRATILTDSPGNYATLSCANTVFCEYLSLKDNHATGGGLFTAHNSINVSGNDGWLFTNDSKILPRNNMRPNIFAPGFAR